MDSVFKYNPIEVLCSDLKIIFITDETVSQTGETDIHMHSFWELFYVEDGEFTVKSESEEYNLCKGEMFIIPPKMYHSTESDADVAKKSMLFTFEKVKSNDDEKIFDSVNGAFSGNGFCKLDDCAYAGMLLSRILEYDIGDKFAKLWRMKAGVTELIFTLYDRLRNETLVQDDVRMNQNSYWVYKYAIDRLMDINYTKDISLEFLSEKLFLSPQNITRIISMSYGKSFNELKLELKMRNAKKMLRDTSFSVSKIGEKIGYTTNRGFLSAFMKYEGCTPSEYRKKHTES